MARVLAISSQVAYGPVGLTALVPALQAAGHEVLAVPTITLSNHPGHGKPAGFRTAPEEMRSIFAALGRLGVLGGVEAVLTGYFAGAEQVREAASLIRNLGGQRKPLVLVDPVIGDGDALYVPEDVARAVRDELLPLARCLTPNRFELSWLSGQDVRDEASAIAAARQLGTGEVLATSIPDGDSALLTLLVTAERAFRQLSAKRQRVPNGTGDFLSGAYLGERLLHPPAQALQNAMRRLDQAIALSAGSAVLDVAHALHEGEAPYRSP